MSYVTMGEIGRKRGFFKKVLSPVKSYVKLVTKVMKKLDPVSVVAHKIGMFDKKKKGGGGEELAPGPTASPEVVPTAQTQVMPPGSNTFNPFSGGGGSSFAPSGESQFTEPGPTAEPGPEAPKGMSTTTMLLIGGAAAVGAYFFIGKKGRK